MTKTYVIGDLHGRNDLLVKALAEIEEQAPHAGKHTIITLGDYVDRGLESRQVIETLMNYDNPRFRMINLMGNHEQMMLDAIHDGYGGDWTYNGGSATLMSYGHEMGVIKIDFSVIPETHSQWLKSLWTYYDDDHRVYVHAGLSGDKLTLDDFPDQTLLWFRYRDYSEETDCHYKGRHVIHGHTPFEEGPKEYIGRTNMDTAAYYTGRLVVGVFDDDKPGSYISTITVGGPTYKETVQKWKAETDKGS